MEIWRNLIFINFPFSQNFLEFSFYRWRVKILQGSVLCFTINFHSFRNFNFGVVAKIFFKSHNSFLNSLFLQNILQEQQTKTKDRNGRVKKTKFYSATFCLFLSFYVKWNSSDNIGFRFICVIIERRDECCSDLFARSESFEDVAVSNCSELAMLLFRCSD